MSRPSTVVTTPLPALNRFNILLTEQVNYDFAWHVSAISASMISDCCANYGSDTKILHFTWLCIRVPIVIDRSSVEIFHVLSLQ